MRTTSAHNTPHSDAADIADAADGGDVSALQHSAKAHDSTAGSKAEETGHVKDLSKAVRMRSRWGGTVALVMAVAFTSALAGYTSWGAHQAQRMEEARKEALSAARTRVPVLLSYQSSRLNDDLVRAIEQTTGPFRDDYTEVLQGVVAPTARQRGISTQAAVMAAGVVSADVDRVTVLVFLTQTTTTRGQRPTVSGSRVEVVMESEGGDWKIAGLQPK